MSTQTLTPPPTSSTFSSTYRTIMGVYKPVICKSEFRFRFVFKKNISQRNKLKILTTLCLDRVFVLISLRWIKNLNFA